MKTKEGREIRLICFDLDDTLLKTDKTISDYTREILSRLKENGMLLLAVSGRFASSMFDVLKPLNLNLESGLMVSEGGGCILNNQQVLMMAEPMKKEAYQKALKAVHQAGFSPAVTDGEKIYFERGSEMIDFYAHLNDSSPGTIVYLDDISVVEKPLKIVFVCDDQEFSMLESVRNADTAIYRAGPTLTEISDPSLTKWDAIEKIMDKYAIKAEEVISFGDSGNDISMLEGAGIGIAMQNALQEAKDAADQITVLDQNHDGMADMLERLFL